MSIDKDFVEDDLLDEAKKAKKEQEEEPEEDEVDDEEEESDSEKEKEVDEQEDELDDDGLEKAAKGKKTPNPDNKKAFDATQKKYTPEVKEDVAALLNGENLSEEFAVKAETIFKAALSHKYSEMQEDFEEEFQSKLVDVKEDVHKEMAQKLDQYLSLVVEEWLEENIIEVHHGIQVEKAKSLIEGVKSLCEDHQFNIPEGQENAVQELEEQVSTLTDQLNEEVGKRFDTHSENKVLRKEQILREERGELADSEFDKLQSYCEDMDCDDEDNFRKQIALVKEGYFERTRREVEDVNEPLEDLTEEKEEVKSANPYVSSALSVIRRQHRQ